jgi:hypothetical protein
MVRQINKSIKYVLDVVYGCNYSLVTRSLVLTYKHLCYNGEYVLARSHLPIAFHSGFAWTVIP